MIVGSEIYGKIKQRGFEYRVLTLDLECWQCLELERNNQSCIQQYVNQYNN